MEEILSSKKMDQVDLESQTEKLLKAVYDYKKNIVYFPVRHHSPACSYHLNKAIKEYQPEVILIEGPCDSNNLIEYLINTESKAPLAIYYSYSDKEKVFNEKQGKYRCYYPFLDYSPEYNALKTARELNITAEFIDMPYVQMLLNTVSEREQAEDEKKAYNNDYLLEKSRFIHRLCEKSGCRDFSEFWEKFYEIQGINTDTRSFIRGILGFCLLSRFGYSEEALLQEGCLQREIFMAEKIAAAAEKYKRILVVAGGFHIYALEKLTWSYKEHYGRVKYHKFKEESIGIYPISYSFEESDQLSGYASGMPYPAYYQRVWELLNKGEGKPFEGSVMDFLIKSGKTITDKIEGYNMSRGLASLRDKREAGVYELLDSAKACFVKGELNPSENRVLEDLRKELRGYKLGSICDSDMIPPILKDFRELCAAYKIKINTTASQELVLDIYKKDRHSEISRFLYTLNFLSVNLGTMLHGPDFIGRKNTNLIRESWKYAWSSSVEARLIEISVYGSTIKEAAVELCIKELEKIEHSSKEGSILLIKAFLMGIDENIKPLKEKLQDILAKDEGFLSTAYCAYNLSLLYSSKELFKGDMDKIQDLIEYSFIKASSRIFTLYKTAEEEEELVVKELKNLYNIATGDNYGLKADLLTEALLNLIEGEVNAALEGAALGILSGLGKIGKEEILKRAEAYFFGSGNKLMMSAKFMKGLFATAREVVLYDTFFIKGIDNLIRNLDEDNFLNLLPDMRLSFSFFSPMEIDQISKLVSSIYKKQKEDIIEKEGVDPRVFKLGREADTFAVEVLKRWGLYDK
ncbi:MAG: DUF5682 family protein [Bacillota bacterium]|nr:DUF5682 family protein [Bacillota bacterium]